MVIVYYSERIQIKISKRKRYIGQGPEEGRVQKRPGTELPVS